MKRNICIILAAILFPAALFLVGGCQGEIDLNYDDLEPVLILNARMSTADTLHTVYVGYSERMEVENVHEAELECYVNGKRSGEFFLEDDPFEGYNWLTEETYIIHNYTCRLRCIFTEGDEVTIKARYKGLETSSTVNVPKTVAPSSILFDDKTETTQYEGGYSSRMGNVAWTISIPDEKGVDNYFRILAAFGGNATYYFEDGSSSTEFLRIYMNLDPINDPVVREGYTPMNSDLTDIFEDFNPLNHANVFSDALFKDGTAKISFEKYMYNVSIPSYPNTNGGPSVVEMKWAPSLELHLQSISFEEYVYLKAMNSGETGGFDTNFLTEPTIIPTNVEGGLGFVGISSSYVYREPFGEYKFNFYGYYYPEE